MESAASFTSKINFAGKTEGKTHISAKSKTQKIFRALSKSVERRRRQSKVGSGRKVLQQNLRDFNGVGRKKFLKQAAALRHYVIRALLCTHRPRRELSFSLFRDGAHCVYIYPLLHVSVLYLDAGDEIEFGST
jgi:hypothetical protein